MADFARLHRTARFGQVLVTFLAREDGQTAVRWTFLGPDGQPVPLEVVYTPEQWQQVGPEILDASDSESAARVAALLARLADERARAAEAEKAAAGIKAESEARQAAAAWPVYQQASEDDAEDGEPLPAPSQRAQSHQQLLRRVARLEEADVITRDEGAAARVLIDQHVARFSGKPTLTVEPDGALVLRYVDRRTAESVEIECSDEALN